MNGQGAPERIAALPCWRGAPQAEPMTGGLSNEVWRVDDDAGAHVVRFGRDLPCHHVIRDRERMTARAAHAAGFGPAVEWCGGEAMVTAFVASRAWDAEAMRGGPRRLAAFLRAFHARMPGAVRGPPYLFWPFHVVRDYARTLREGNSPHAPALPRLLALNAGLGALVPPQPIVFGHNDLLPANVLEDGERLWLIDYEYAGFSMPLFDLANAASNSGMGDEEAEALLWAYHGERPDAALRRAFDAMACASLLREAMWAMVSALHLAAPGVDYDAYAAETLGRLDAALDRFRARHGRLADPVSIPAVEARWT